MSAAGRHSPDAALAGAPEAVWRGVRAFKNGQYNEALQYLRQPAQEGDLQSCLLLSRMYFAGHGVDKDNAQYVHWLARAADLGDPAARSKLKRFAASADMQVLMQADPVVEKVVRQFFGVSP